MQEAASVPDDQSKRHEPDGVGLSLVILAWNEQETIRQAIREARAALAATAAEYEIIVVDDGSTDGTPEIVREEAAADPHVRLVQHPHNLGHGAALRTGFQAATLDLVALTDADSQFDLSELAYMLPLTRHYDIACGYRTHRHEPARRRFFSWSYNTLLTLLVGSPVRDPDCTLKIFHRKQLPLIRPECDGSFVNTEMLTKARLQGLSVVEVGVRHRPRVAGRGKVCWRDAWKTLSSALTFWWTRVLFPSEDAAAPRSDGWSWIAFAVLAFIAGALLFFNLSYPLMEPDEGRHAEIARAMLTSGDWIVPRLHQQPYFNKPPLFHWLVAGSLKLFGTSDRSARLVPALAAFLTVIATFLFGRRLTGTRGAFLAGLVLTLMPGFILCGRFVILDSLLTLCVTLALFTAYEAIRGDRLRWPWWTVSAVGCALGVLTKGPLALILVVPPLVAHLGLTRRQARPGILPWCAYLGLVLGLAAPWYVAMCAREPEFAYQFFIDQNLQRFFTREHHDNPIWFYLPVLLLCCLPWSLLLFPFLRFLFARSAAIRLLRFGSMGFLLLWAAWCVLFFSLSRGKLPSYILPALPAVALLLGCYLEYVLFLTPLTASFERLQTAWPRRAILILSGTWLLLNLSAWLMRVVDPTQSVREFIETGFCLACLVGVAFWGRRLPSKIAWVGCCLVGVGVILEVTHDFVPAFAYRRSMLHQSNDVAEILREGNTAVACYGPDWNAIHFSLGRDDEKVCTFLRCQSVEEVQEFLGKHARTLLVLAPEGDPEMVHRIVPPGGEVIRVAEGRKARFVLVQVVAHAGKKPGPMARR